MAKKERKMLRNDDEIQLFRKESYSEDDPRHKCELLCRIVTAYQ
jgi:hypothetical protein